MNALSHIDYSNRLPRGRSYANKGAVKNLRISGRKIIANVKGTRITPYKVTVDIPAFTSKEKKELADLAVSTGEKWVGELSNRDLKAMFSIT